MHLFVDISAHGFGHLAITAPVLNALAEIVPELRLTVRSGLPASRLHERIAPAFTHLPEASDFGFAMLDATRIDLPASAAAYRTAHADWPARWPPISYSATSRRCRWPGRGSPASPPWHCVR